MSGFYSIAESLTGVKPDIKRKADKINSLNNKVANQKKTIASNGKKIESLNSEIAAQRKTINSNKQKMNKLRIAKDRAKGVAGRTMVRVGAMAARNTASLPAKAAPIAGWAVVIGMTAWELRDLCETMKDMAEIESTLDNIFEPDKVPAEYAVCGQQFSMPDLEKKYDEIQIAESVKDYSKKIIDNGDKALITLGETKNQLMDSYRSVSKRTVDYWVDLFSSDEQIRVNENTDNSYWDHVYHRVKDLSDYWVK